MNESPSHRARLAGGGTSEASGIASGTRRQRGETGGGAPEPPARARGGDGPKVPAGAFAARVAERGVRGFARDAGPHLAGAIAYRVLFSIFPLAIVLAGIFGIVLQTTGLRADVVDAIVANVPLSDEGQRQLRELLQGATGNLSGLGLLGVLALVWAASGMMGAIRHALNRAWGVDERRPFLQGKAVDLLLVLAVALLVLLSLGLAVGSRLVARYADEVLERMGMGAGDATWLFGVAAPFVLAFVSVLFLYRVVPAVRPPFGEIWLPALAVALVFALLQSLFAVYLEHFGDYNAVYGSLGAVVAFLFFVYASASVFILGAEVAAEWPRVRYELEHGLGGGGPPLSRQILGFLRGLVVRTDGGADEGGETPSRRAKR